MAPVATIVVLLSSWPLYNNMMSIKVVKEYSRSKPGYLIEDNNDSGVVVQVDFTDPLYLEYETVYDEVSSPGGGGGGGGGGGDGSDRSSGLWPSKRERERTIGTISHDTDSPPFFSHSLFHQFTPAERQVSE